MDRRHHDRLVVAKRRPSCHRREATTATVSLPRSGDRHDFITSSSMLSSRSDDRDRLVAAKRRSSSRPRRSPRPHLTSLLHLLTQLVCKGFVCARDFVVASAARLLSSAARLCCGSSRRAARRLSAAATAARRRGSARLAGAAARRRGSAAQCAAARRRGGETACSTWLGSARCDSAARQLGRAAALRRTARRLCGGSAARRLCGVARRARRFRGFVVLPFLKKKPKPS